jgi:DNA-directed RNA polymerase specialized sigma24 family protein
MRPRAVDTGLGVDSALRILPPEQRAAFVVVDILDFSVADAAVLLDTSSTR